jgi:hypothetical protein
MEEILRGRRQRRSQTTDKHGRYRYLFIDYVFTFWPQFIFKFRFLVCGVNIVVSVAQLSKFSIFIVYLYEYYIIWKLGFIRWVTGTVDAMFCDVRDRCWHYWLASTSAISSHLGPGALGHMHGDNSCKVTLYIFLFIMIHIVRHD